MATRDHLPDAEPASKRTAVHEGAFEEHRSRGGDTVNRASRPTSSASASRLKTKRSAARIFLKLFFRVTRSHGVSTRCIRFHLRPLLHADICPRQKDFRR